MLPMFYESVKGEEDMKEKFKNWRFCCVDTKEILQRVEWNYLFEGVEFVLLSGDEEILE